MHRATQRQSVFLFLLATLLALASFGAASGGTPDLKSRGSRVKPTHGRRAVLKSRPVAGQAGMRIFKDPQTGDEGPPSTGTIIPLEANTIEDGSGLSVVSGPLGSQKVDLQGRFEEAMIVQLDAKGHRVMNCVKDPKAAFKQTPAPAPAPSQPAQREEK